MNSTSGAVVHGDDSKPTGNWDPHLKKYLLRTMYMEYLYVEFVCKYLCVFYIYIGRSRYVIYDRTRVSVRG